MFIKDTAAIIGKKIVSHKGFMIGLGLAALAFEGARRIIRNRRSLAAELRKNIQGLKKESTPYPKNRKNKRETFQAPQIPQENLSRH